MAEKFITLVPDVVVGAGWNLENVKLIIGHEYPAKLRQIHKQFRSSLCFQRALFGDTNALHNIKW